MLSSREADVRWMRASQCEVQSECTRFRDHGAWSAVQLRRFGGERLPAISVTTACGTSWPPSDILFSVRRRSSSGDTTTTMATFGGQREEKAWLVKLVRTARFIPHATFPVTENQEH